jgi:hypothetical protein
MPLQQLVHLLELEVVVGVQGDLSPVSLDLRHRVLEVVALAHLARHVGERIVDLGQIGLGNDIERRHLSLRPSFCCGHEDSTDANRAARGPD